MDPSIVVFLITALLLLYNVFPKCSQNNSAKPSLLLIISQWAWLYVIKYTLLLSLLIHFNILNIIFAIRKKMITCFVLYKHRKFSKQAPMCLTSKLILSNSSKLPLTKAEKKLLFKPTPFILYVQFSIKHPFF